MQMMRMAASAFSNWHLPSFFRLALEQIAYYSEHQPPSTAETGRQDLPLSPFSPLCPRGPGGPGRPGGPAGPLSPGSTERAVLSQVGAWGLGAWRGHTHRFLDSTGKGVASQQEGGLHRILVAASQPPLTFGSLGAHLSFLPRGSWNGSISCRGRRLASDKRSLKSLRGKGICSGKHRKGVVELGPKENKVNQSLSDFQPIGC